MLAMLWAAAHAADCATPHTDAEVREELAAVRTALEAGDAQRFEDGMRRLDRAVDCLGEVPRVPTMAEVRLFKGIRDFGIGRTDSAAAEFLGSRALDPAVVIPVYPREHAIYGVFERHDPVRAPRERLPPPRRGEIFVDGYPTRERYRAGAALVQHVDGDTVTRVAQGPDELARYPRRHPVRNGLIGVSVGLGAVGGALIAASRVPHGKFHDQASGATLGELTRLRSQTNTLATLGLTTLGAAAGAGAFAVVFRTR